MSTWSLADRKFPTYPVEPLLLYKDEKMNKAIYVRDGTLLFHSLLEDQAESTILLNITASEGYYWKNGNTLLLAVPIYQSEPGHPVRGDWNAIELGDSKDIQPTILKLEDAFYDPAKLLTVTIAEDTKLFALVIDDDNGRFNEYLYQAGADRLSYVTTKKSNSMHIPFPSTSPRM